MTHRGDDKTIRSATPEDAATLRDLSAAFFAELDMPYTISREQLAGLLTGDTPRLFGWLAERDRTALGFALCEMLIDTNSGDEVWVLHDLFVARPHRDQGIGRRLFETVRAETRKSGAAGMSWIAERESDRRRFYERLGARTDPATGFFTLSHRTEEPEP